MWGARRAILLGTGVHTQGKVVDFASTTRGVPTPIPVLAFTATDGKPYRIVASTSGDYKKDERLEVVYHAAQPASALVNDFQQLWLGPLALTLFGAFFAGFGALAYCFLKGVPPMQLPSLIGRKPLAP